MPATVEPGIARNLHRSKALHPQPSTPLTPEPHARSANRQRSIPTPDRRVGTSSQSMFMLVVPVIDERYHALKTLLGSMILGYKDSKVNGLADPHNAIISFAQFSSLHAARLLILESLCAEDIRVFGERPYDFPAALTIAGEIDGREPDFLAELAIRAQEGLEQLFSHCAGFEAHEGTLLEWMQRHATPPVAHYFYQPGLSVQHKLENAALHRFLASAMPGIIAEIGRDDAREIRQRLLTQVQLEHHAGRLPLTQTPRASLRERIVSTAHLLSLPVLAIGLAPLVLLATPFFLWWLRRLETSDPDIELRPTPAHIDRLSDVEDYDVTNSFNVFGDIKPGLFRRWTLSVIMYLVDWFARHIYTRGSLGRVRTIHSARWVWLNGKRSMCFMSQYDGSLESYMDDFINKVSFGLNLTFSYGVGYPRTRWMIKGGAELEQPYKDTLRRHQMPSAVWYRVLPGHTAFDIARSARVRAGVDHYPADDKALRRWLAEI